MKNQSNRSAYDAAFVKYLRYGIPIEASLKAYEHSTHYVWRTKSDHKVRSSHAKHDGKLFAWSNPPETGHPGEGYNCRCVAEPYIECETEYIHQELTSEINDNTEKWTNWDFVQHALKGGDVKLEDIGHLQDIINHYAYVAKGGVFMLVNQQIIGEMRTEKLRGNVSYEFRRTYDFKPVSYSHGGAQVSGEFQGFVSEHNGILKIKGTIHYRFHDVFTDPLSIRENRLGTSDPKKVDDFYRQITDLWLEMHQITGEWKTELTGEVKLNETNSIYKNPVKGTGGKSMYH